MPTAERPQVWLVGPHRGTSLLAPAYLFYLVNRLVFEVVAKGNVPLLNFFKTNKLVVVPHMNPDTYALVRELVVSDGSENLD